MLLYTVTYFLIYHLLGLFVSPGMISDLCVFLSSIIPEPFFFPFKSYQSFFIISTSSLLVISYFIVHIMTCEWFYASLMEFNLWTLWVSHLEALSLNAYLVVVLCHLSAC